MSPKENCTTFEQISFGRSPYTLLLSLELRSCISILSLMRLIIGFIIKVRWRVFLLAVEHINYDRIVCAFDVWSVADPSARSKSITGRNASAFVPRKQLGKVPPCTNDKSHVSELTARPQIPLFRAISAKSRRCYLSSWFLPSFGSSRRP